MAGFVNLPGGGGAAPALRQVATRCSFAAAQFPAYPTIQSRTRHWLRDDVRTLRLVFANWWADAAAGEHGNAAPATIRAAVELPSGASVQASFGGQRSGVIAPGGDLVSDPIAVVAPPHTPIFVRSWFSSSTGCLAMASLPDPANTDTVELGDATLTDRTGTTGPFGSGSNLAYFPSAILSLTRKPAALLLGDSILFGAGEAFADLALDRGIVARSIGPAMGYINGALTGDIIANILSSGTRRIGYAAHVSHIVSDYGGPNDYARGAPAVIADIAALGARLVGRRRLQCTRVPNSRSTDNWATIANQATDTLPYFTAINDAVRAVIPNWDGFLDTAAALETAPGSGLWQPGYANDGTHPNLLGSERLRRSGLVRAEAFTLTPG